MTEWDRCAPWIQAALDDGGNVYTREDVAEMLACGEAMFWPGRGCALVTRIEEYPQTDWLLIWLGGGDLAEIRDEMVPRVEAWGLTQGCTKSIIIGRVGWSKALCGDGYRVVAAVVGKDLAR